MPKKALKDRAGRVRTWTRKDGTVVTKDYGPHVPKPTPLGRGGKTVADLILAFEGSAQYKKLEKATQWMYSDAFAQLDHMKNYPCSQVKREFLIKQRDLISVPDGPRGGQGAALKFCTAVSSMFHWAMKQGTWGIKINPAISLLDDLKLGEIPAWTTAQVENALRLLPERLWRIAFVVAETDLRRSDVLALQWTQDEGDILRVVQKKLVKKLGVAKATILVVITPRLRAALDEWKKEARVHRVWERGPRDAKGNYIAKGKRGGARTKCPEGHFTSGAVREMIRLGEPGTGHILVTDKGLPWRTNSFASQFSQCMTRIALAYPGMFPMKTSRRTGKKTCALTLHGIRKWLATDAAESGGTAHEIMALGGWNTLPQAQLYTRGFERLKAAKALWGKIERKRARAKGTRNVDPELEALLAGMRDLLAEFDETPGTSPTVERKPFPNRRHLRVIEGGDD